MYSLLIWFLIGFIVGLLYIYFKKRAEVNAFKEAEFEQESIDKVALALAAEKIEADDIKRAQHVAAENVRLKVQKLERESFVASVETPPWETFMRFQGRRLKKPVNANGNGFDYLPVSNTEDLARPGVYGIYAGSVLLYVGKANGSIRTRLREHAKSAQYITEGGAQQNFLYAAMREHKDIIEGRVLARSWDDSATEIAALEMKLIKELSPLCNIITGTTN